MDIAWRESLFEIATLMLLISIRIHPTKQYEKQGMCSIINNNYWARNNVSTMFSNGYVQM